MPGDDFGVQPKVSSMLYFMIQVEANFDSSKLNSRERLITITFN